MAVLLDQTKRPHLKARAKRAGRLEACDNTEVLSRLSDDRVAEKKGTTFAQQGDGKLD